MMLEAGDEEGEKSMKEVGVDQANRTTRCVKASGGDDGAAPAHIEGLDDQGFQCRKLR
jgi:hypothetical protein